LEGWAFPFEEVYNGYYATATASPSPVDELENL
jgi:hypothetical protein